MFSVGLFMVFKPPGMGIEQIRHTAMSGSIFVPGNSRARLYPMFRSAAADASTFWTASWKLDMVHGFCKM